MSGATEESELWSGRPSWKGYKYPLGLAAFWLITGAVLFIAADSETDGVEWAWIGIAMLLGGAYSSVTSLYDRFKAQYRITTKRIICKYGILSTQTIEIDLCDIRTISVSANLMQRFLNLGDIEITTASGAWNVALLRNLESPEEMKEALHRLKNGGC